MLQGQTTTGLPYSCAGAPAGPLPSRKRGAATEEEHAGKRRRTHLAHGFSGLSIEQQYHPPPLHHHHHHQPSDGSDDGSSQSGSNDMSVEELDDPLSPSSSSSFDSEATSRPVPHSWRPRRRPPMRPNEIEDPDHVPRLDVRVQDMGSPTLKRSIHADDGAPPRAAKRRKPQGSSADDDMDMDDGDTPTAKRRTQWYEPEKDRIVITSIGSDSSRESTPPQDASHPSQLSQPGEQGFTLSPSLLTHLLNAQRSGHDIPNLPNLPTERGLVLYKPLNIDPNTWPDIVKEWQASNSIDDSGRFEELDDDEFTGEPIQDDRMDIE